MDAICLKAGVIPGMTSQIAVAGTGVLELRTSQLSAAAAAMSVDKPTVSSPPQRNSPWGFTFRSPLRSLWPGGGKNRYEPAIAVDDGVLVEEKEEKRKEDTEARRHNENWVFKIMHVRSMWKEEKEEEDSGSIEEIGLKDKEIGEQNVDDDAINDSCCEENEECDGCPVDDDDDKIEFDRESFSKLLRKVPLTEARLYAQMSYLGNLAYSISQIKPGNLLRYHGLRFVTSSLEKKEEALKADQEKAEAEDLQGEERCAAKAQGAEGKVTELKEGNNEKTNGNSINSSAAYQIGASAASYLHSHAKGILRFKSSKSGPNENLPDETNGTMENVDTMKEDVASFIATTDSVTAVVAAKEEVKQAVADDLKSTLSSPCEWFVCDDDESATRFFVIQGSETLASWQANLLFEPIQFEELDVLVHRGIYEAAKGIYEQMLPEIREHLKSCGHRAKFRFTGHSLGGSLSLLVNLMLLIRGEVPVSSLLPVVTFGAPSIMCGGDHLLRKLGLPRSHVQAITMHRDIVPRAFSCNYPNHVAEFLKAVNGNFRTLPCLNKQKLLYAPMGEFLILQPDEKFSPSHHLLPSGSGLYLLSYSVSDVSEAEKLLRAAQTLFLNSPHPLEILSDRSAYGSEGTIQRDHDMNSYLKSVRSVIRQELNRIRKAKRQQRRKFWWPLVAPQGVQAGIIVSRPVVTENIGQGQFNVAGIVRSGKESLKRFSRLVASQHTHLLVVLLFPARLLILETFSLIKLRC